jgi:hypothetical protein
MKIFIRWRLRTVFAVITAVGIWLGLETNRIRHRREILVEFAKTSYGTYPDLVGTTYVLDHHAANWLGSLLGDCRVKRIYAVNRSFRDNEEEELGAVFPESEIAVNITNGSLISDIGKRRLGLQTE